MIVFDVVYDEQLRQVGEELRLFGKEGAVVLISLDHKMGSGSHVIRFWKVKRDSRDQVGRIQASLAQQVGDHGSSRGLAMGTGNDNGGRWPQVENP